MRNLESSIIRCHAWDCRWNFCPVEDQTGLLKFVQIGKGGKCGDYEPKQLEKP